MAKDRWRTLCDLVKQDDRLPIREVGHWTEEKLWFWNRYIEITTTAMVGSARWSAGLIYVDLFAGPGVCQLKTGRRRIPGSALIAANAPKAFRSILLCEKDPVLAQTCQTRVSRTPVADRCRTFVGDCNDHIDEIAACIPDRALTLAFIDPTGLDAKFDTIKTLADRGRVDLLILFADAYDVVRNVDRYERRENSKLDQTLGPGSDWRRSWRQLTNRTSSNVRKLFAEIYKKQLENKLGYQVFGEKVIRHGKGPLYLLIYASKHPRGLEFWDKVTGKDPSGQKDFGF